MQKDRFPQSTQYKARNHMIWYLSCRRGECTNTCNGRYDLKPGFTTVVKTGIGNRFFRKVGSKSLISSPNSLKVLLEMIILS